MACTVAHDNNRTTIYLVGQLDDRDFDDIENGFELALDRRHPAVIFDFLELEQVTALIIALMGVLRIQAYRAGTSIELRNVAPDVGIMLTERDTPTAGAMKG
ncbi:MAG: hypothetical protein Q7R40_09085 [Phaeospirillum sp.]|nr:hypothetical protein [Phaeospirillum sp.]